MRKLLAPIVLSLLFAPAVLASETGQPLLIEMSDPKVRITIPGMPTIDMDVHPMNEEKPYFRLLGSSGNTSVSIVTAATEAVNTPISCATALANSIIAQDNIKREQVFLGRANEQTFLIIYGLPLEESVLLNTHIVSAGEANRCIEAHISKESTSEADIEPWYNGFADSNIEKL